MKINELNLKLKQHLNKIEEDDSFLQDRLVQQGWDNFSIEEVENKIAEIQDGDWYPQYTKDITALQHRKAELLGELKEDTVLDDIQAELTRLDKEIEADPENDDLKKQKAELQQKAALTSHKTGATLQESKVVEISTQLAQAVSDQRDQNIDDLSEKEEAAFEVYVDLRHSGDMEAACRAYKEWQKYYNQKIQAVDKKVNNYILNQQVQ